jgi:hypothetical protein
VNSTAKLFQRLSAELEQQWQQVRAASDKGVLIFPPRQIEEVSRVLFSSLISGGYCTFPVTGSKSWSPRSHYFEALRTAARRGRIMKVLLRQTDAAVWYELEVLCHKTVIAMQRSVAPGLGYSICTE